MPRKTSVVRRQATQQALINGRFARIRLLQIAPGVVVKFGQTLRRRTVTRVCRRGWRARR